MNDLPAAPEAVAVVASALSVGEAVSRADMKTAVKLVLADLTGRAPGKSVEVRVPPFAAVQVVSGATHRRGTPPALVQMSATTVLGLATGVLTWAHAVSAGQVRASGERSDLSALFPLYSSSPPPR